VRTDLRPTRTQTRYSAVDSGGRPNSLPCPSPLRDHYLMSSPRPARFRDDRSTSWSFVNEVNVACPRCSNMALVVRPPGDTTPDYRAFGPRRLVCSSCGYTRDHPGLRVVFSPGSRSPVADPFFGAPLWLQLPTRHGVLWAYNLQHLAFIERFVAAHIRERASFYDTGRKMTMIAKLPAWLKHRGNREENLRNIARLRESAWTPRPAARIRGSRPRAPRTP
jgi:hypothetical protein